MKTIKYILMGLMLIMIIPFCNSQIPGKNKQSITIQSVTKHASDKFLSESREILLRRLTCMSLQDVQIIRDDKKSELVVTVGDSIPRETLMDLLLIQGHFNIYETMNRLDVLKGFGKNPAGCLKDAVTKLHLTDTIRTRSLFILGSADGKDSISINSCLNSANVRALLPKQARLLWSIYPVDDKLYNLNCIASSDKTFDEQDILEAHGDFANPDLPMLCITFKEKVWKSWSDATARNINQSMVMVIDGKVYAAPRIADEIPHGKISLTGGGFTMAEVRKMAAIISSGAMPVKFDVVNKN
jgi:hypothetical protein